MTSSAQQRQPEDYPEARADCGERAAAVRTERFDCEPERGSGLCVGRARSKVGALRGL